MKQTIKTLTALVLGITILFSCSKDNDEAKGKSKTELLTNGSWKLAAYTSNPADDWDGDGVKETDFYKVMETCEKDDITTFKTNGDVVFDYKTLCDYDSGPQTETEKWDFTNNETTLRIKYNDTDIDTYQIVELTASTLKVRDTYTYEGITYTEEITYTH
ncbi:MAG TPA: lipocalin family protein [Niabella sp.]|nr:lipocalin family protein [Niabella sp.]